MKPSETSKLLAIMAAAYPSAQLADETAFVYASTLGDLEFESVRAAVCRLIATHKFLPTVAEIREEEADLRVGPARAPGEAWGELLQEIHHTGYMGTPSFRDPLVAQIVRSWGWRALCCEGELVSDRARFLELYAELQRRHRATVVSGMALPSHQDAPGLRDGSETTRRLAELTGRIGKATGGK
ncbi:MAG: hypothetical protein EPO32_14710 [Anaerolineae bacterium]|nr:MAG: hypothetical protein EPO32_14710 [Anaerolineae bacterium]